MEPPINQVTLAIDMGNSGAKAAIFRGDEMIDEVVRFSYRQWKKADELVTNHKAKNIVYSSVANVPPQELLDKWTNEQRLILALLPGRPLPFPSLYETPETLGQDRIAAVLGYLASSPNTAPAPAQHDHLPKHPVLIVDAGTCVTVDLVDGYGTHLGGNISPGLRMRLRAMHEQTARLPLVEPTDLTGSVGTSTVSALHHGGQMGLVYELEGLYARLLKGYPDLRLLLTGGDGAWLSQHLSAPCSFRPNLVLCGLNQLMSTYVRNKS